MEREGGRGRGRGEGGGDGRRRGGRTWEGGEGEVDGEREKEGDEEEEEEGRGGRKTWNLPTQSGRNSTGQWIFFEINSAKGFSDNCGINLEGEEKK